jgi:hypothetical protein
MTLKEVFAELNDPYGAVYGQPERASWFRVMLTNGYDGALHDVAVLTKCNAAKYSSAIEFKKVKAERCSHWLQALS